MIPLGIVASARRASSSWLPTALGGLVAWFDPSDAATITHSSGAVSALNDKSGNARHLAQSTGTAKPTTGVDTIGGLNVLTYDGGDYLFRNSVTFSSPMTLAYVLQSDTATPAANQRVAVNPASTGIRGFGINDWYVTAGTTVLSGVDADTSPHLLVSIFNGASSSLRLDGAQILTGNPGTTVTNAIALGGANSGGEWLGTIGESVLVAGALSGGDLTSLETYLLDKWGL